MKTAVSIPDDLLDATNDYARRSQQTRSEVVAEALRHYLALHDPDHVVEALNDVVERVGLDDASFANAAAQHILKRTDW